MYGTDGLVLFRSLLSQERGLKLGSSVVASFGSTSLLSQERGLKYLRLPFCYNLLRRSSRRSVD